MTTVKRLSQDDLRKILASHFKVNEDKVDLDIDDWRYGDWICDVEVDSD